MRVSAFFLRPSSSHASHDVCLQDGWRRAHLRAKLGGQCAHLYGLMREELADILDTFPIVHRKDEAQYGEYRTKRMVLKGSESPKH